MAKGHIDDATIGKVLQILQFAIEGDTILNAQHDALATSPFIFPQFCRCTGNPHIITLLPDNSLYLIEDIICIGRGILGRLRQIGSHDGRVETTLGHLLQIDEDTWIALIESDALWEEHRGVAMGVERQNTIVQLMGLTIILCLFDQPLEQGQTTLHTFRMPLNAKDRLELVALHRLDDAIRGSRHNTELRAWVADSLMMEGVYFY